jgi:hypothetical protein
MHAYTHIYILYYVIDVYMQIWQCSRCKMPLSEVLRAQSRLQVERPDMDPKRIENGCRIGRTSEISKNRKNVMERWSNVQLHVAFDQFAGVSHTQVGPIVFLDLKWCGHFFFPAKLNWAAEILVWFVCILFVHSLAAYFSLLRCMRTWRCADWKEDRMTIILTSESLGTLGFTQFCSVKMPTPHRST